VLPDTPQVTPSDIGVVRAATYPAVGPTAGAAHGGESRVEVTFPSQGLIISYDRSPIPDPLGNYRSFASQSPGSEVVYLNGGVPALAIAQIPDGSNWGSIEFVSGGTQIVVMGHRSDAYLQAIAQSIVDRSAG
jgi:hypothetical protein